MENNLIYEDINIYLGEIEKEKRIKQLKLNNNYDERIVNFYHNGYFVINNKKTSINMINLLVAETNSEKKYIIDFVDSEEPLSKDIKILEIIKFRDSSMFEILMNKYRDKIKDNTLKFDQEMTNYFNSLTWDGKLHTLVPETHEMVLSKKS